MQKLYRFINFNFKIRGHNNFDAVKIEKGGDYADLFCFYASANDPRENVPISNVYKKSTSGA